MRILHIVESLDRGGLERVVCDLVLEQIRSGDEVDVFCLFHDGAFAKDLLARGVSMTTGGKRPGLDWRLLMKLRRFIRRGRYSIVHTHNPVSNYYAVVSLLTASWRPPLINTRHNMGAQNPNDRREKIFRLSVCRTERVVMVSNQVAAKFVESGVVRAGKVRVQVNGVPFDRCVARTPETTKIARQLLGLPETAKVMGTVGRLVAVKNQQLLVNCLKSLSALRDDIYLVLIGAGPLKEDLASAARKLGLDARILFAGERPDIPDLLPALDVFVLPSLSEGHSIALLEAAAAGLALVASAVGGNPEIVSDGTTGLLVSVGDADATANAVQRLLLEPALNERLGRQARKWALTNASMSSMAIGYAAIYRDVLNGTEFTERRGSH